MNHKKRVYGKLLLDLLMLILLALLYRKNVISMRFHEIGGLVLYGLFLAHTALNWQWMRAVTVSIFKRKAKLNLRWVVDSLLLVSMTAVLITGILISKTLPTAIANRHGLQVWHYFFAAASLVLSGIHLGLHGAHLRNHLWNKLPLPQRAREVLGILLLCTVFCFGSYSLPASGFISHFSRPFVAAAPFYKAGNTAFAELTPEQAEGEHTGSGMGYGKGMGNGKGISGREGQSLSKNHTEQGRNMVSVSNVLPTLATYASILGWFAVVTGVLEYWFCLRRRKHQKEQNGTTIDGN